MIVQGSVDGALLNWKIDTGAKSTFITGETFEMIVEKPFLQPVENSYVAANGQKLEYLGKASMTRRFGELTFEHEVIVGGVNSTLLGEDFITTHRCVWDHDEFCLIIKGSRMPLKCVDKNKESRRVIALETLLVPSKHEAVIKSGLTNRAHIPSKDSFVGILTPEMPFSEEEWPGYC